MRRIAIEEHFYTQEFVDYLKSTKELQTIKDEKGNETQRLQHFVLEPGVIDALVDLDEGRLKHMDEAGIDMQVLSFNTPGIEELDAGKAIAMAKKTNDALARVIKKNPKRFAGFAALPYHDPTPAARELERAVKELGLKGAKIDSHVNGEFLDDQKYWPIFEKAEKLGVPIYLHPKGPPPDMLKPYLTYSALAGPMLGYGAETSLHAMRLICSGVFDKYPGLTIILGHLGEALPFWMWRLDKPWRDGYKPDPRSSRLRKRPSEYVRDNFFVTTSGMCWQPALICVLLALGADKILFAADHPWEKSQNAVKFMDSAALSDADKEKIYHFNAEKLLGL